MKADILYSYPEYKEDIDRTLNMLIENDEHVFVVLDDDRVAGGVGLSELDFMEGCAELQKLYLADFAKGRGTGYTLIRLVEEKAAELGYEKVYLETHSCLTAAIHMYEKCGFKEIEKPEAVVHSTMDRFFLKEL